MHKIALVLTSCFITTWAASTVVQENSDSEQLRYFEFPDGDGGAQPQQIPPDYGVNAGGDPLFRQGLTNGTVVIVPSKKGAFNREFFYF